MIAIVDYGMGNLASVYKALKYIGYDAKITTRPEDVLASSGLIVPGVGAFGPAMEALKRNGLDEAIKEFASSGKPTLGICLGMQLFLTGSEEGSEDGSLIEGLNIIPGKVLKFPQGETVDSGLKVPQMGWNSLEDVRSDIMRDGDYVYFVHSFYCLPDDPADALAKTTYGIQYAASVGRDNVIATQFHPEKSGQAGLQMLIRFARRIG